ncbi:hypothetical protein [Megasphaera coli]|uniref:hypothetical protein n=1 Tax=Colibacter massiliensis TaxID=1852379 RepID=UPI00094F0F7F|nr:hypothetical protein [Colibacter massiliensis]
MKSYVSAGAALCLFLLTAASFAANSAVPAELAETGAGYSSGAGNGPGPGAGFSDDAAGVAAENDANTAEKSKNTEKEKANKDDKKVKTNYKVKAIEDSMKLDTSWQDGLKPYDRAELPPGIKAAEPHPLSEDFFVVAGLRKGTSLAEVLRQYGQPQKRSETTHLLTLNYEKDDMEMRVVLRKEVPPSLSENHIDGNRIVTGVESVYLSKGDSLTIGGDLQLHMPAELLVRRYGAPQKILRDADANVYYFVYMSGKLHENLIFALGDRKIQRVALMPPRAPYLADVKRDACPLPLKENDFTLMGFVPGRPFIQNKYNMWQTVIKRGTAQLWLYGDYGVEVDKAGIIHNVFLLSNSAFTSRGVTIGYNVSTLLAAYGVPNRIEKGPNTESAVDAYYYDSPFGEALSLVFIIRHDMPYVNDVILTDRPIEDLQDPLGRYDLKEKRPITKEHT